MKEYLLSFRILSSDDRQKVVDGLIKAAIDMTNGITENSTLLHGSCCVAVVLGKVVTRARDPKIHQSPEDHHCTYDCPRCGDY